MSRVNLTTHDLLSIGRFSRVSGLTVKALRHYDEIGLLSPARVDEDTGYRYYSLAQARDGEAIRRLRSLAVPLDEIRALIGADSLTLRERLLAHRARIEGRAVETARILAELQPIIDGKESLVPEAQEVSARFELHVKEVPAQWVAVVGQRSRVDEMSTAVPRAIDEVGEYLVSLGIKPVGPPVCICPSPDDEGMIEHQTGWPVAEDVPAKPPIEARLLAATRALVMKHVGPYAELGRSYRLMAEVMEENGLGSADDPRELYWSDPEEVPDPKDYVTEIVWPIGPEGELDETRDVFARRALP